MIVTVLGTAQDGGFPEWDCNCLNCQLTRKGDLKSRFRSSLAIEDEDGSIVILDASPDIRSQVAMVKSYSKRVAESSSNRIAPIDAILITHAHWGHIMGLLELSAGYPFQIPVYCSKKVASIIRNSTLFNSLIQGGFIKLIEFSDGEIVRITAWNNRKLNLSFQAFRVPHREDFTDTYGLKIFDDKASITYIPDIKELNSEVISFMKGSDALFFEATFYQEDELLRTSGIEKTSTELGHIPIIKSLPILRELKIKMKYYIHFNHTNPVLRKSIERRIVEKSGLKIAFEGLTIQL